ncbi:MAG TPA: class I SAM-dependent methyltransferase, partial [Polyangiaceae bacterium]
NGGVEYGVFECSPCGFKYPVIAGIPIMVAPHETLDTMAETDATVLLPGPSGRQLVELVEAKQTTQAFASLLNPSKLDGDLFFPLRGERSEPTSRSARGRVERVRQRAQRAFAERLLPRARLRLAEFLSRHAASLSALGAMDLYYRRFSGVENFNYFAYRFGQPRHLAGLALASRLDGRDGPVLDIACGVGHMAHYFAERRPDRVTFGLDRDFFRLWVANRYVAPRAHFVCAPADRALPFAASTFDGIFCSDAFHYFLHRAHSVRELRRLLTREGMIVLARFGNARVAPREGYELDVAAYGALFADMPHAFIGEERLVQAYLQKRAPDLRRSETAAELESQKWLSIVASHSPTALSDGEAFEDWPHAVGRLALNPIYRETARSSATELDLEFRFPSHWYEFENAGYLNYAPQKGRISRAALERANHADGRAAVEQYVSEFLMLGMPDLYS